MGPWGPRWWWANSCQMSLQNDQDPRSDLCSTIHTYPWGRGPETSYPGEKAYFAAPQNKGITAKDVFLCCTKGKVVRWQVGRAFKGWNTARLFAHGQAQGACWPVHPRERLLKPGHWPEQRWVGRGKLASSLLTPGRWPLNLRGVLAQAFSLVKPSLESMVYSWVEQNGPLALCFLLFS